MNPIFDLNLKALKDADLHLYKSIVNSPDLDIEIIQSKNGYPVPKINGVMIHSTYDPIKEAEAFVDSYNSVIETQDILLVMGCGFAYHVEALAKLVESNEHKFIFVIEPNVSLFKKMLQYKDIRALLDKVTFIVGYSIEDLFSIPGFYQILNAAPYTIGYKPIINLSEDYFIKFIERRSSNKVEHLKLEAEGDDKLMSVLNRFQNDEKLSFSKIVDNIATQKANLTHEEKMFILLKELAS